MSNTISNKHFNVKIKDYQDLTRFKHVSHGRPGFYSKFCFAVFWIKTTWFMRLKSLPRVSRHLDHPGGGRSAACLDIQTHGRHLSYVRLYSVSGKTKVRLYSVSGKTKLPFRDTPNEVTNPGLKPFKKLKLNCFGHFYFFKINDF